MTHETGNDIADQVDFLSCAYDISKEEAWYLMCNEERRLERDRAKHQREYQESLERSIRSSLGSS